jgi:hypothetical protein
MTSIATIMGAVPLVLAGGAGAPHTRSPDALARALDKLEAETPIARDDHAPVRP